VYTCRDAFVKFVEAIFYRLQIVFHTGIWIPSRQPISDLPDLSFKCPAQQQSPNIVGPTVIAHQILVDMTMSTVSIRASRNETVPGLDAKRKLQYTADIQTQLLMSDPTTSLSQLNWL
jgi:hypothetical protein